MSHGKRKINEGRKEARRGGRGRARGKGNATGYNQRGGSQLKLQKQQQSHCQNPFSWGRIFNSCHSTPLLQSHRLYSPAPHRIEPILTVLTEGQRSTLATTGATGALRTRLLDIIKRCKPLENADVAHAPNAMHLTSVHSKN